MSYVTPKKNAAFIFYIALVSQASRPQFQTNPTLAAGDVLVSGDGGATANITTLPTVTPSGGKMVKVSLSAAEMNFDNVTVIFTDVAGAEWDSLLVNIQTSARQIDDLLPTTSYTAPDNATITAINAKTTNLPSDPADASDIAAAFVTVNTKLDTIDDYVDTEVAAILAAVDSEVAAIKVKTDLLPAAPAAVGDIPTSANVADAVWDEAIAGHAVAGSTGAALTTAGAVAADPLLNTVPGSYASGTAGAALGRIGSGQIVTTSPVAPDGDVTIWAGYDMLAVDGYSLDWTDTSNVWPVLTGATIAMICRGPSTMSFVGSVVTATGVSKKVRVELQDTQTVDMPISNHWVYDVAATLTSGDVIPLVKGGRLYVKAKPG